MDQRAPKQDDPPPDEHRDDDRDEEHPVHFGDMIHAHPWITGAVVVVIIAAIVGGVIWWLNARHYEWTDDAFIDARQFAISSKAAGFIQDVKVTDNQRVATGDLLVQIDDRDYRASLAQAAARVSQAAATVGNDDAQIAAQKAQVAAAIQAQHEADAALVFAKQEDQRAQTLVKSAVGTVERAQQTRSQLQQAQATSSRGAANVEAAKKQLAALEAQRVSGLANVEAAKADEALADLNLSYTHVTAAQSGRIVQLTAAKGQYVQVGQNLMMFVPRHIWVTANFKETQITDMRPGQPVSIEIDAYPNREFKGHVDSLQAGSGTAFSLLPAENATGNYVKVVQRVPVKIEIDNPPTDVTLGPGMSVVPQVKVR